MNLPFTVDQFVNVFALYNDTIWPVQIFLNLLGLFAIVTAFRSSTGRNRTVSSVLSFFWLWMGIVYHILHFTAINPAAYIFGAGFVIQGFLMLYFGVFRNDIRYSYSSNANGILGCVLTTYAMIVYPLVGVVFGHIYPYSPTFGAPCPTTIFTFGMLLWTTDTFPKLLLIIPAFWSVIGFTAAVKLGIYEDIGLLAAGIISVPILLFRKNS